MKKGVIVILVVGIAAVLGFFANRLLREDPVATAALAPPELPALSAPRGEPDETPAAQPATVVPELLPQFELADREGKKRRLSEWKGRPLMVNYWATWCGPCRREIPLLNELRTKHKAMKLEVIGIAVDFREDVLKYVKDNPISYPLLIGEEDGLASMTEMGMPGSPFPFTVFADSQQRIVAIKLGELFPESAELILERLAKVDAGTLPLPEARKQISDALKEFDAKRAAAKASTGG